MKRFLLLVAAAILGSWGALVVFFGGLGTEPGLPERGSGRKHFNELFEIANDEEEPDSAPPKRERTEIAQEKSDDRSDEKSTSKEEPPSPGGGRL